MPLGVNFILIILARKFEVWDVQASKVDLNIANSLNLFLIYYNPLRLLPWNVSIIFWLIFLSGYFANN